MRLEDVRPRSRAEVVIGVGASAGGLEAMLMLLSHVRRTGRVAYVVAQHMADGAHTDLVVRVIQRESALPVSLGTDGLSLEVDRVVVIPAGHHGIVVGGTLRLMPPTPERLSMPSVDVLMESLAAQYGSRAMGLVLSGAGFDGAQGCRAILKAGGVVLAQESTEAGFASMPEAAAALGRGVRALKASQMGAWICRHLGEEVSTDVQGLTGTVSRSTGAPIAQTASPSPRSSPPAEPRPENLTAVMSRVNEVTGIDFSEYRPETLIRRLQSRKRHLDLDDTAYQSLLMRERSEAERLQKLFLVSLSSFWRDRECFEALAGLLGSRLQAKAAKEPVRVWVPGCASGEEAFTLAALLTDTATALGLDLPVHVVGTDLNPQALEHARGGSFAAKAFKEAPPGWKERWFVRRSDTYTVRPELAQLVHFEQADIETGLPKGFDAGRVDIVSCRNLLIYFLPSKQERLLRCFGQALRADGLLFIGPSETLATSAQALFRTQDATHRIFVRRAQM